MSIKAFYQGQIEALNEAGFETTVVCAEDNKLKELLPMETKYHPMSFSRVISPLQDIKTIYKLYKLFKKEKFDIVQYSTPKAALLGSLASFIARLPVRIYILWGLYYTGQKGIRRFLFKLFEKIMAEFIPTAKNKPAEQFYDRMFKDVYKSGDGARRGDIDVISLAANWPEEIELV